MEHGTYRAYTSGGCRCDQCRAAKRAYDRKYRWRNGLGQAVYPPPDETHVPGFHSKEEFEEVMAHDHLGIEEEL